MKREVQPSELEWTEVTDDETGEVVLSGCLPVTIQWRLSMGGILNRKAVVETMKARMCQELTATINGANAKT